MKQLLVSTNTLHAEKNVNKWLELGWQVVSVTIGGKSGSSHHNDVIVVLGKPA